MRSNMLSFRDIRQLVKQKKARDEQGLFVIEGRKLFSEAPPEQIRQVILTDRFAREYPELLAKIPAGADVMTGVGEERFAQISDTKSPQGILTVLSFGGQEKAAELEGDGLYLLLEHLQDPGNAGTILRTAEAAGADGVFLTEGSVDLYAPKKIRSTMGSIFRVPHRYVPDASAALAEFRARGITSYAAHLKGRSSYTEPSYRGGTVFVIGNESRGITDETAGQTDCLIRIPMAGRVESLNAAMAAGILMFEAKRQRELQ